MTKTTHSTSMNKNELEQNKYINTLYSIVDKLEQRISTLEKVLASHAKCIGEMRADNDDKELQEDYKAGKFEL